MIAYTPLKNDPDRYNIETDVRYLSRLAQNAKDIMTLDNIIEGHANSTHRPREFWDSELAAITRIMSGLVEPFYDFFITAVNAEGDIAVDRSRQEKNRDPPGSLTFAWSARPRRTRKDHTQKEVVYDNGE
jgi:hypothetical protein